MKQPISYNTLLIDIGGVILTNGWDYHSRELASQQFNLDLNELNRRHSLMFDTYERGRISLDDYLDKVVFYEPKAFSVNAFKKFMFAQSELLSPMFEMMVQFKKEHGLKVIAITNEGKELMQHRIRAFPLKELIDVFICSGFVHLRKPDPEIYQLAIDLCQSEPNQIIYIDDRELLVQIGKSFGLKTIHHREAMQTIAELDALLC